MLRRARETQRGKQSPSSLSFSFAPRHAPPFQAERAA
jgi:hypothetical protein